MSDTIVLIYLPVVLIWCVVLAVAIYFYRINPTLFGSSRILLLVMILDTARNILENIYFGLYFGGRYGVLSAHITELLGQPFLLMLPKLVNIGAAILVLFILLLRWLPKAAQERSALRSQADTDALTGLNNRRRFLALADAERDRACRYGRPLSLVMIDIDNFKAINDRFGHDVGDQCIVAVAGTCQRIRRDSDVAGRFGGEEFALLLPETDLPAGRSFAERLREEIAAIDLRLPGLKITASIGVAGWNAPLAIDEIIKRADLALYDAKRSGRNRVCEFVYI
jgi:diguanylate cyclase (GGDEF)-like protein